ncbi:hypothetical protein Pint_11535 [Pistacia integerrima]|uniref:Uncharacterized protein n=1 Tax=Pistacia integerrima TaxID=434235 RepID=A0ACC0XKM2_9ROSI|nr:hypothetical protein Pint_11535 [Pistacia integerrima]
MIELPQLVEFPQWLIQCSTNTLERLDIFNCSNLKALPESMKKLQVLNIRKCRELSSLPKDMDHLISLRELVIEDSPKLSERCEPEIDSRLAIKCGGKQLRVDNIVFEANDGGASFNVLNPEKWALSNVGLFSEGQFNTLPQNTSSEVINTTTPDLYQTSRQSPGSLRYYGLGLENGVYNVSLFFTEIIYEDQTSRKWWSLGRRVFYVYMQVNIRSSNCNLEIL